MVRVSSVRAWNSNSSSTWFIRAERLSYRGSTAISGWPATWKKRCHCLSEKTLTPTYPSWVRYGFRSGLISLA
ncbi:Uncharacterised protein [Bordetella pertussis]|nr:Uncharacterised protein [Bordetella pertussis]